MKRDVYMLVRQGLTQRMMVTHEGAEKKAWPIAISHDDAMKLCAWMEKPGVRPALIGSIVGETLEGHCRLAVEDGCELIVCVDGWKDGEPIWQAWKPKAADR